jgi:putative phosphoesterase
MRVAVLSDIHGNLTALQAVLADLRQVAPDLIVHGGDLCDGGSSPIEILDAIRGFGWHGVMGNTDEMLVRPDSLEEFARGSAAPTQLWVALREIASATRSVLGGERLSWLSGLPQTHHEPGFAVVHGTPQSSWQAPATNATDTEFDEIYGLLGSSIVVFGHIHRPFIRKTAGPSTKVVINTGSVGLPHDGDARASYLVLDENEPHIRRVVYDVERELTALSQCGLPGAAWTAKMLRTSSPQLP